MRKILKNYFLYIIYIIMSSVEEVKEVEKKKYFKCEYCLYVTSRNEKGKAMMKAHRQRISHLKRVEKNKKYELDADSVEYLFNNCSFRLNSDNTYEKRVEKLSHYGFHKYMVARMEETVYTKKIKST